MQNINIDALDSTPQVASNKQSAFDVKNYLNVKLAPNEDEKSLKIRIITPNKDSNSWYEHIHMHSAQVPKSISESGFKSYVCLNRTHGAYSDELGTKCPFCEENHLAFEKAKQLKEEERFEEAKEWTKRSLSMRPNEVCIFRVIERGKEDEGVKFWKFNLRSDKMDPENQIRQIYKDMKEVAESEHTPVENILDLDTGRDFKVTITRVMDKNGNRTNKTSVKISVFGGPKPLTTDPILREKWLNDPKVWSDVFVAKPYDYTKVILDGGVPFFSKETGKWIDGNAKDNSVTSSNTKASNDDMDDMMLHNQAPENQTVNTQTQVEKRSPKIVLDDDLPF